MDSMIKERKYRNELFQERVSNLKEKERSERNLKIQKYNKKLFFDQEHSPITSSVNFEEEPHYQRMVKAH